MTKIKARIIKVEDKIENQELKQGFRPYLGASLIGDICHRKIWFQFRCFKDRCITPRQDRLFSRGHKEEPIIIADLEKVGVKVKETQKGEEFAWGHGGGHCDGILTNLPGYKKQDVLAEFKTANERNFKLMKSQGIKASKPGYYDQAQIYMDLFGLKVCLFIVVNKNTDERYYEVVKYRPVNADVIKCRAANIAFDKTPPRRISENSDFYYCKWCDYQGVCHFKEKPRKGCRTCRFSEPLKGGKWFCKKTKKEIAWHQKESKNKQLKGCKKYKVILNSQCC